MSLKATLAARRSDVPMRAIRQQFGATMVELAAECDGLVALTADLMYPTGMAEFAQRYPDRFFNVGIAEQNMTGIAAGLASCGKLPVVCGYAAFTTLRAVEQAKVDCAYNNVRVLLVGQSAGLSYGVGGPSHQTFEDVAIMRAIPNMTVVVPSDAVEVDQALRSAVRYPGTAPIYLRLGRGPEYVFNDPESPFEIGRARRLRRGDDLCIIANGPMVFEALLASDSLATEGIQTEVLTMHTVKPIDTDAVRDAAARVRGMLVVEEHNVLGGLGAAVLEVLEDGHAFPVRRIGIADQYPPVGPVSELRVALGLSAENIVAQAHAILRR
ncbi:MAG: transketolase family protein [Actinobacteria bacterium]|nr:transketolase family protein [Actinomycetota bacterium]